MKIEDAGWCRTKGILSFSEIKTIKSYIDKVNIEKQKVYQFSKRDQTIPEIEKLINYFYSEISDSITYKKVKLSKIWCVNTSEGNSEPGKLPYIPHFDKRRFIKLMIYLNDVSSIDGPFTTATHHVNLYEAQRKSLPDNYKKLGLNSKLHEHIYSEITFTAGSGVIFDTNCAHFAKPVMKGGKRLALRFDFEDYDWNKHLDLLLKRIWRSVFS